MSWRNGTIITNPSLPQAPLQQRLKQLDKIPEIPVSFDGRKVWAGLLTPIVNQKKCASCYAIANVSALNDRMNIVLGYKQRLSYKFLVKCLRNPGLLGCNGGSIWNAAKALTEAPTPFYNTYKFHPSCRLPGIVANYAFTVTTPQMSIPNAVDALQREIMLFGPVVSQMQMYQDFYDMWNNKLESQIYTYNGSAVSRGGHAVKIVGWGPTYWIVANSWGKTGGIDSSGYFYIRKGKNEAGIELNGSVCATLSKTSAETQLANLPLVIPWAVWAIGMLSILAVVLLFSKKSF